MKNRSAAIAKTLYRELIRDRVFFSVFLGAFILILSTLVLNEMVVGEKIKATKDLGLSILNLFSLFIVIFLAVNLISRDIIQKNLYFLFAKPVKRSDYLRGGYLSVLLALLVGISCLILFIMLVSLMNGEFWLGGLLIAGYLTMLEMLIIVAFALLFTIWTSPQLAMFLTLIIYVIGHSIEKAAVIVDRSTNIPLRIFIQWLEPILPNLEFFNRKSEIIYRIDLPLDYFIQATLYSLAYTAIVFILAVQVFNKREL